MLTQEKPTGLLTYAALVAEREQRWNMRPDLKLYGEGGPLWFIEKVGVAVPFSAPDLVLPSLWWALLGQRRQMHDARHDWAAGKVWNLKDTLPAERKVWYGKLVKSKPAFISLSLLPAFYALSPNYGELDDYLEQYKDGLLSDDARRVYEAVLAQGPASTTVLRKAVAMQKGDAAARFDRAIASLTSQFKIMQVGTAADNRWKYCFVYDAVPRHLPEQVQAARQYTASTAIQRIISTYLPHAVAVPRGYLPKLFGWDSAPFERAVNNLLAANLLHEAQVSGGEAEGKQRKGEAAPWLAWSGAV